jgi:hypothetical protein
MQTLKVGDQLAVKGQRIPMTITGKGSRWLLSWIEKGEIITERYMKGTVETMVKDEQWIVLKKKVKYKRA